jgi:hypothetical protein
MGATKDGCVVIETPIVLGNCIAAQRLSRNFCRISDLSVGNAVKREERLLLAISNRRVAVCEAILQEGS